MLNRIISAPFLSALVSAATNMRSFSTIEPNLQAIETAAATALTDHTTTNIAGKAFDNFVIIWLENTDRNTAASNSNFQHLAEKGITLTNYWGISHPSEPNYISTVGGDYFGLNTDNFVELPKNVSTIVDLLEEKNISWGEYQEHIPYSGYQGFSYSNRETHANDYMRKHNPLISYDSITDESTRLAKIKNFTEFEIDLQKHTLPQWIFITPNMTNDGHDSNVQNSSSWARSFLEPLIANEYFNNNTAILLTFDENKSHSQQNKVWALLLGGAVNSSKYNTTDDTYYTHYSEISTVQDNWDLYSLGRYDSNEDGNANVFKLVADVTGYKNKIVDTSNQLVNQPVSSYFSDVTKPLPPVNCSVRGVSGRGILPSIKENWCSNSSNSSNNSSASNSSSSISSAGDTKAGNSISITAPIFLVSFGIALFLSV